MTYHRGMGAVAAGSYPTGTKFAAGYYITGLVGTPANAVEQLRQAMQAGFLGRTLEVGWGPKHGVPSGHLYALVETARDGITGDEMNTIFSRVGAALQSRGVGSVRNTQAHLVSRPSTGLTQGANALNPTPGAAPIPGAMPTTDPSLLYDPYATQPTSFMSQTVGGIPVWGLMVGSLGVVGLVGYSLLASARRKRVVANRRSRATKKRSTRKSKRSRFVGYMISGRNVSRLADPFARMTRAEKSALMRRYKTSRAATRAIARLHRRHGGNIAFELKALVPAR